jgi:hypothetical protein
VQDIQFHAICLFFRDYTIEPCGIFSGWLNFLPDMYLNSTGASLIQQAVFAAAYSNLGLKIRRSDMATKALSHYCASLHAVKSSLSNKFTATSDDMMTAVTLLLLYEVSLMTVPGREVVLTRYVQAY